MTEKYAYGLSVFINCPFSPDYRPIFQAILFAVFTCGYRPRCALEVSDSSQNRLEKIHKIIGESRFGIHDISNTEIDGATKLPRFNMPFETGVFFAAKHFGSGKQKSKVALVLDKTPFEYRKSLSDISGQDISIHYGKAKTVIKMVRDWLNDSHAGPDFPPGGDYIFSQYKRFARNLPNACKDLKLKSNELTYSDSCRAVEAWLRDNT